MANKRILIVEDEQVTALDLKSSLNQLGYEVAALVSSGEEAVRVAAELRPDLVLMDITLRGPMDGIEAAAEIRKRHAIPIIYLTAHTDASMVDKAKTTEPFGYLSKPCTRDSIKTTIDVALYKSAADVRMRESEKRYRELVELAMSVILRWDTSGTVTFINEYGAALFGYRKEELVGRAVLGSIVDEIDTTGKNLRAMMEEIVADPGKYLTSENENATKDGRHLWMHWRNSAVLDDNGNLVEILSIGNDITERKQAERYGEISGVVLQILNEQEDLRNSIQRILAVLKTQTGFDAVGLRLQSGEDFPYFVQEGFSRDFLLTENTLIDRDPDGGVCRGKDGNVRLECTCGLVLSGSADPANQLFTKGGSFWTNDSFTLLDIPANEDPRHHPRNQCVHQRYASVALVPIRNKDKIVGLIQLNDRRKGCFTLHTVELLEGIAAHLGSALMRKQAEEALRSSRDFIENILNTVDDAFIVIDREYTIVRANTAYGIQVGRSVTELVGKHCYEISHQSSLPCFETGEDCAVRHCFDTGAPYTCVHKHAGKDGAVLYVETKSFPLKDADGEIVSAIQVINNITDKHLLEEQMLRTQKLEAVGLLAGGIAHDFNNLLQGVFGSISMAKMTSDREGKAYGMLEQAESALYQATNLTKQLLTFSKGGEPVKSVISLQAVIDNAVRFALSGSNINYQRAADENLWPVEADEGQINQVVHNIVLNASEAMPDGGTVRIEMKNILIAETSGLPLEKGTYVQIDVKDSGMGIPENVLAKIFDPYFTTKKKGSGLGLATSYSIIKRHGGVIMVNSQFGAGATFTLYLPASAQGSLPEQAATGNLLSGKGRILVMDDENIVRMVAGHMMTGLGYEAVFAENGEQALEHYSHAVKSGKPFDAVILDLTIRGGMGGKETVKRMAEIDPSVRAIVSSGYSADDILAHYRDHGFLAVLSKPYQIEELSRVLHEALRTTN